VVKYFSVSVKDIAPNFWVAEIIPEVDRCNSLTLHMDATFSSEKSGDLITRQRKTTKQAHFLEFFISFIISVLFVITAVELLYLLLLL
jgi:predicted nucleic acid-binding Zn ribbon protein